MIHYALVALIGTFVVCVPSTTEASFIDTQDRQGDVRACTAPFVPLGERCVHLDEDVKGTWQEMREFCQSMGSDLATFASANFFFDSLQYFKSIGAPVMQAAATMSEAGADHGGQKSTSKSDCVSPFVLVGGRCVHLDFTVSGTWEEAQQFCQAMGSNLAVLSDPQFFFDIHQYIKTLGETGDIWVGASDIMQEGLWLWTDGTPVVMGTPCWANYGCDNEQEPNGGTNENCAHLREVYHYFINDISCADPGYPLCVV